MLLCRTRVLRFVHGALASQMARVIVRWNVQRLWAAESSNCQHFVCELLAAIGLTLDLDPKTGGVLARYLAWTRGIGRGFSLWMTAYPALIRRGKVIAEWKTHAQMDAWFAKYVLGSGCLPGGPLTEEEQVFVHAAHRGFCSRGAGEDGCLEKYTPQA